MLLVFFNLRNEKNEQLKSWPSVRMIGFYNSNKQNETFYNVPLSLDCYCDIVVDLILVSAAVVGTVVVVAVVDIVVAVVVDFPRCTHPHTHPPLASMMHHSMRLLILRE